MQATDAPLESGPPPRPTLGQVLLGVFIVWQLFYMAGYNLLLFRSHTKPPLDQSQASFLLRKADAAEKFALDALVDWGELTGQTQGWWMFAMTLPESTFPLVELRGPNGIQTSPSAFDPGDSAEYFRSFGGSDRLFHYEMNLTGYNPWREKKLDREETRKRARPAHAYLRWRLKQFQHEHPGTPVPDEIILYRRDYPIPPQTARGTSRPRPIDRPLFRWRPGNETPEDYLPVEAYDPSVQRFVPLRDGP